MLRIVVPDAFSRRRAHQAPPAAADAPVNAAIRARPGASMTTQLAVPTEPGCATERAVASSMSMSTAAPVMSRYEVRRPGSVGTAVGRVAVGADSTATPPGGIAGAATGVVGYRSGEQSAGRPGAGASAPCQDEDLNHDSSTTPSLTGRDSHGRGHQGPRAGQ